MERSQPPSTPEDIVADMAAFAMSSDTLRGRARGLAVGESFSFVPRDIPDGPDGAMYLHLAGEMGNPFTVRRIALDRIPEEYGLVESDLPHGSVAFLMAAQASPQTCQLATLDPPDAT